MRLLVSLFSFAKTVMAENGSVDSVLNRYRRFDRLRLTHGGASLVGEPLHSENLENPKSDEEDKEDAEIALK